MSGFKFISKHFISHTYTQKSYEDNCRWQLSPTSISLPLCSNSHSFLFWTVNLSLKNISFFRRTKPSKSFSNPEFLTEDPLDSCKLDIISKVMFASIYAQSEGGRRGRIQVLFSKKAMTQNRLCSNHTKRL